MVIQNLGCFIHNWKPKALKCTQNKCKSHWEWQETNKLFWKPVNKGKEWNLSSPASVQGNQTTDEVGSLKMSHLIVPLKKDD